MDRDLAQTFHGIASLITPVRAPDKRSKHPNSDGHPLITRVDTRRCQHIQRRTFAFSNEIVTSHMVIFSLRVTYPDPLFEGRLPEAPKGLPQTIVVGYRQLQETLAARGLLPYFIPWTVADGCRRLPPKQGHIPGHNNGTQHPLQARKSLQPFHQLQTP